MDIFEIVDSFDTLCPSDEKAALLHYLQKGDEERALSFLNRVGMLNRNESRNGLFAALRTGSPELFRRLLDHVPRGEYADELSEYELTGTMPTLAAALGKAEHLRLLLDWGCDVNGASLEAATAIARYCFRPLDDTEKPLFRRGALTTDSKGLWNGTFVSGLTPLAAALLSGSVDCVRLLLTRKGVWLTESPGVSEALALRGAPFDTAEHRECRRLIRTRPDGTLRPLLLWAAIRRMDAVALRDELCRCAHGREEALQAALVLAESTVPLAEKWSLFSVLGRRFPDVMQDRRVTRKLAELICSNYGSCREQLPEAVDNALGETVDLDGSTRGSGFISSQDEEACLRRLSRGRRLVMSRDAVFPYQPSAARYLRVLMKYVEFRAPSFPLGVSGLTQAILSSGDVKLLRAALEQGLIPVEEPIGRLLELAGRNTAARSLLLTHPRPSSACVPEGAEEAISFRELTGDERKRVLDDPALRAQASEALLWWLIDQVNEFGKEVLCASGFETHSYAAFFALRGETDTVLRLALRHNSARRAEQAATEWLWRHDKPDESLELTLLCCAAASGKTETVCALLDAGFDPEERDWGRPSSLPEEPLALSPLLCALLWEHWDTAALLIDRGAACDLTTYTVRRAFEKLRGGDVPYGDILRELGAYLEGRKLG